MDRKGLPILAFLVIGLVLAAAIVFLPITPARLERVSAFMSIVASLVIILLTYQLARTAHNALDAAESQSVAAAQATQAAMAGNEASHLQRQLQGLPVFGARVHSEASSEQDYRFTVTLGNVTDHVALFLESTLTGWIHPSAVIDPSSGSVLNEQEVYGGVEVGFGGGRGAPVIGPRETIDMPFIVPHSRENRRRPIYHEVVL